MIWELHVIAKVTFFLKVSNLQTNSLRFGKTLFANITSKMGLFWSIILSKILLSVGPIFTVLPITFSFLVRFRPVKYRIETLDMIYFMVRG